MGSLLSERSRFLFALTLWSFIILSFDKYPSQADYKSLDFTFAENFEEKSPSAENTPVVIPKRLYIEKLSLDVPVVAVGFTPQKTWVVPEALPATAEEELNVGGGRNISIWGHRESVFARLAELEGGDEIVIDDGKNSHLYKITEKFIVTPKETWVMNVTSEDMLTLITCDPPKSRENRLIIRAKPAQAV